MRVRQSVLPEKPFDVASAAALGGQGPADAAGAGAGGAGGEKFGEFHFNLEIQVAE